ncbi:MAG: NAD(P)-binding domain-containing protein [Arenimonas sp.]|nr:NAD(P)-binding domain-containing protein [Arenimonas sp.]
MASQLGYLWIYLIPLALLAFVYFRGSRRAELDDLQVLETALETGMTEPPSLHPVIDTARCIGSGSCVSACPEGAIGIIGGKAVLKNPTACIGHGACYAACPVDGINLVFGTERRGVDIPDVHPNFESNVPGLFIAGELGGMGLIRKAAEQGRQAIEAIATLKPLPVDHDVVIVGAGPAGISAGLAAVEKGMRYLLLEQEADIGGAIFRYPRNKVAMTAPVKLPIIGMMRFTQVSKEKLLEFWQDIIARTGLRIRTGERMESVERDGAGAFEVTTSKGVYRTRAVLLAVGRHGSPRKLDVPGESLPKVMYRVTDPEQFTGQDILVVGGGDSAVEAAIACSEAGAAVTLSYRGEVFNRIKAPNRERLQSLAADGRLRVLMESQVARIDDASVDVVYGGATLTLANDAVIVSIGGLLPIDLLKSMGIRFETHHGEIRR